MCSKSIEGAAIKNIKENFEKNINMEQRISLSQDSF